MMRMFSKTDHPGHLLGNSARLKASLPVDYGDGTRKRREIVLSEPSNSVATGSFLLFFDFCKRLTNCTVDDDAQLKL